MVTNLLSVVLVIVLIAAVIGLFRPEKVVFWKNEGATQQDVIRWYLSPFILLALLTAYLNGQ